MTSQNIVIGGLAGAMPPLLGWSAITNTIEPNALLLVLIIMVWTPPHFWALAVHRVEDYADAEVPMLPVQKGVPFTKQHILLYTFLLLACTTATLCSPDVRRDLSRLCFNFGRYIPEFIPTGFYIDETNAIAMPTFAYSIFYLAAFCCGAMLIDHFIYL